MFFEYSQTGFFVSLRKMRKELKNLSLRSPNEYPAKGPLDYLASEGYVLRQNTPHSHRIVMKCMVLEFMCLRNEHVRILVVVNAADRIHWLFRQDCRDAHNTPLCSLVVLVDSSFCPYNMSCCPRSQASAFLCPTPKPRLQPTADCRTAPRH